MGADAPSRKQEYLEQQGSDGDQTWPRSDLAAWLMGCAREAKTLMSDRCYKLSQKRLHMLSPLYPGD